MIDVPAEEGRLSVLLGEAIKLPAFARRDMIVAWSYRFAFFSDAFSLVLQAFLFYFVGLLVDDSKLPEYGGSQVSTWSSWRSASRSPPSSRSGSAGSRPPCARSR